MEEKVGNTEEIQRKGKPFCCFHVPEEILLEIFFRLPAKSLIRFKSVCKAWYNTISDPDFVQVHAESQLSKFMPVYSIFSKKSTEQRYEQRGCLCKLDEHGTRAKEIAPLPLNECGRVSSCDGLILIQNVYDWQKLHIYDTITHRQQFLPSVPGFSSRSSCSLIYDPSRRNYKVVMFCMSKNSELSQCLICSLDSIDNWRTLTPCIQQHVLGICYSPIRQNLHMYVAGKNYSLKGIYYWTAYIFGGGRFKHFIQPLDIATEEFMEIIKTPCVLWDFRLSEMKGSLCLINIEAVYAKELSIWVLQDSAKSIWVNQQKISLLSTINSPFSSENELYNAIFCPPLVVESCNDSLRYMLVFYNGLFHWYNLETQETREITMETDSESIPYAISVINPKQSVQYS